LLPLLMALHASYPAFSAFGGRQIRGLVFPLSLRSKISHGNLLLLSLNLLPYWKSELKSEPPFQCASPEKYSRQGRSIQGMQEDNLGLWICDFLLFFVGGRDNYKRHRNLWSGPQPGKKRWFWLDACSRKIKNSSITRFS
jgi:hypothetical protein